VSTGIVEEFHSGLAGVQRDPVLCVSGAVQFGQPGTAGYRDTAQLLEDWAKAFVVVLLPVDPATVQKQVMHKDLLDSGRVKPERLFINTHILHYGVWLAVLSRCDLLLSVRLHAAVMASATGTPFIMLYGDEISRKAKDFLLGTVGGGGGVGDDSDGWKQYFLKQSDFGGSVEAVSELLRIARS
jgi:hypothetical protein